MLLQHPLSLLMLYQQQKQLLQNILALVPQREFGDGVQMVFQAAAADLVDNVGDMSATMTYCQIPSRQVILSDTTIGADTGIRVGDSRQAS